MIGKHSVACVESISTNYFLLNTKEYVSKEKGISYVEKWCRVVKETGSFRFKRGENLDIVKDMFPELPSLDEGYKLHWSQNGDTFNEIATFGDGTTFTTTWKYDVETPFMGIYS